MAAQLPAGFVLDEDEEQTAGALPPGFQLDAPKPPSLLARNESVASGIPEKTTSENIGTLVDRGNIRNAQAVGGLAMAAADAGTGEYDWSLMGNETHYPIWSVQGALNYVGDVAKKVGGDIVGLGVDAADMVIDGDVRASLQETGKLLQEGGDLMLNDPKNQIDAEGFEGYLYEVGEGLYGMSGPLAVGALTGGVGMFGALAAQVGGAKYGEVMEKTGGDHVKASNAALFAVAAEALPEMIPMNAALRKGGGGEAFSRIIETTLGEGAQEWLTSILEQTYDANQLENMSLKDAILGVDLSEANHSFLVGLGVGTGLGTPGAISDLAAGNLAAEKEAIASGIDKTKATFSDMADKILEGTGLGKKPEPENYVDDFSAPAEQDSVDMDLDLNEYVVADMKAADEAAALVPDGAVVPEAPETIERQLEVMRDPAAERKAVYLPEGQAVPDLPEGERAMALGDGSTLVFPESAESIQIVTDLYEAIQNGDEAAKQAVIAGATGIGGQGKTPGAPAVVVTDPDGTVVQSAVADPAGEVLAAAEAVAEPRGAEVSVEDPQAVVADRGIPTDLEAGLETAPVTDLEAGLNETLEYGQPQTIGTQQAIDVVQLGLENHQAAIDKYAGESGPKPKGNEEQLMAADSVWVTMAVNVIPQLEKEGYDVKQLKAILHKAAGNKTASKATSDMRGGRPIAGRRSNPGGKGRRSPTGGWGPVLDTFHKGLSAEVNRLINEGPTSIPKVVAPLAKKAAAVTKARRKKAAPVAEPVVAESVDMDLDLVEPVTPTPEYEGVVEEPVAEEVTEEEKEILDVEAKLTTEQAEARGTDVVGKGVADEDISKKYAKSQRSSPEEEAAILAERAAAEEQSVSDKLKAKQLKKIESEAAAVKQAEEIAAAAEAAKKIKPVIKVKRKPRKRAETADAKKARLTAQMEAESKAFAKNKIVDPALTEAKLKAEVAKKKATAKKPAPMGKESLGITTPAAEAPVTTWIEEQATRRIPDTGKPAKKTLSDIDIVAVGMKGGTEVVAQSVANSTQAGDIATLSMKAGDAVVSPANNKGYMKGNMKAAGKNIDGAYVDMFGDQIQDRVQAKMQALYDGDMPLGEAFVIRTYPEGTPIPVGKPGWLVVSPTVTYQESGMPPKATPDLAGKAMTNVLKAVGDAGIDRVFMPAMGMGSTVGAKNMQNDFRKEFQNAYDVADEYLDANANPSTNQTSKLSEEDNAFLADLADGTVLEDRSPSKKVSDYEQLVAELEADMQKLNKQHFDETGERLVYLVHGSSKAATAALNMDPRLKWSSRYGIRGIFAAPSNAKNAAEFAVTKRGPDDVGLNAWVMTEKEYARQQRLGNIKVGTMDFINPKTGETKTIPEVMISETALAYVEDSRAYMDSAPEAQAKSLAGNPEAKNIMFGREIAAGYLDEVYDERGVVRASDVLDIIDAELAEGDPYKTLIQRMRDIGVAKIMTMRATPEQMGTVAKPTTNGAFINGLSGEPKIMLNDSIMGDGFSVKVFMHEMVHAMTSEAIRTNNATALKLEALRKRVIKELEREGGKYAAQDYGFTNVDEFVAEAMTNPSFQRALAGVNVGKGETLWTKFIDIVSNMLGVPVEAKSALAEALTLSNNLFMSPTEIAQARAENAAPYIVPRQAVTQRPLSQIPDINEYNPTEEELMAQMQGDGSLRVLQHQSVRGTVQGMGDIINRKMDVKEFAKDASNSFSVRLNLSTMDQVIRNHSHRFVKNGKNLLKNLQAIHRKKTQIARELQQKAGSIDKLWKEMEKFKGGYKMTEQLGKLMRDSTLNNIHPDAAFYSMKNKHLWYKKSPATIKRNQERHTAAQAEFNKLTGRAKSIFRQVREFYKDQRVEMRKATIEKIAKANKLDGQLSAADMITILNAKEPADIADVDFTPMADMADGVKQSLETVLFSTSVEGPYFPLRRFGDVAVDAERVTTSPAHPDRKSAYAAAKALRAEHPLDKIKSRKIDGSWVVERSERIYETFETERAARKRVHQLNSGPNPFKMRGQDGPVESTLQQPSNHVEGSGAGALLQKAKGKLDENSQEFKALETAFTEMLLANSLRKAELKRNRVKGASINMRRGFAERAFAGSWALADLKTSFDQAEAMSELDKFARTEAKDKIKAGKIVRTLNQRWNKELSERKTSKWDAVMSKLGFTWFLMSPSYTLINLTQPMLVAQPYLIGKYGFKGADALFKAYNGVTQVAVKELWKTKAGWQSGPENMLDLVVAEYKGTPTGDMIQTLADQGIIDATFMQELYEASQGKSDRGVGAKVVNKTMDIARTMPQIAEVVNRVVVAKAAYELEIQAGASHAKAVEGAGEAILQTQFDYSDQNKPPLFKGFPGVKSVMMFKMYGQGMYALFASNIVKTFKGGTPELRAEGIKTVSLLLASHTAAAGTLGGLMLEPIRALLWALSQLLEEDDEEWDVDATIEIFLKDTLGDGFWGEAATRGLFSAAGIGGGERVALSSALLMPPNDTKDVRAAWIELLLKLGGPVVGATVSIADGIQQIKNGDYVKGTEKIIPKGFRDMMRGGYRYPVEGPTGYGGEQLPVDLGAGDMISQFFGVTPAAMTKYYAGAGALKKHQTQIETKRKSLIHEWSRSDNPVEFEMEHVMPFNMRHDPKWEVTEENLKNKLEGREDKQDLLMFGDDDFSLEEMELQRLIP